MKKQVTVDPIERHPLRDAYMINAPREVNPFRVPYIGTLRECKKARAHLIKKLKENGFEVIDNNNSTL